MELRLISPENSKFLCPICRIPVYLVSPAGGPPILLPPSNCEDGPLLRMHARRAQRKGDRRPPTTNQESRDHLRMKEIVAESIACDPRFSLPKTEGDLEGALGEWRRPERPEASSGLRMAFEIQLSTAYIRVIAERREFSTSGRRPVGLAVQAVSAENGNRLARSDDTSSTTTTEMCSHPARRRFRPRKWPASCASSADGRSLSQRRFSRPPLEAEDRTTSTSLLSTPIGADLFHYRLRRSRRPAVVGEDPPRRTRQRFEGVLAKSAERGRSNPARRLSALERLRKAFDEVGLKLTIYPGAELGDLLNAPVQRQTRSDCRNSELQEVHRDRAPHRQRT